MANVLNSDKERLIYAEWTQVRDAIAEVRQELTVIEGREISEAEFMRRQTLETANRWLKSKGRKTLVLDSRSGPGGVTRKSRRAPNRAGVTRYHRVSAEGNTEPFNGDSTR